MSHQREGQATCWGYGHCSLRSTGECGKCVKSLQSERSLKGRTSLQGAVGSKGILVGFLFWYGICLFVCFKLLFLFWLALRFFFSFQFVARALGLKAFWCPWQPWQGRSAAAALRATAGWRPTTAVHQRERGTDPQTISFSLKGDRKELKKQRMPKLLRAHRL